MSADAIGPRLDDGGDPDWIDDFRGADFGDCLLDDCGPDGRRHVFVSGHRGVLLGGKLMAEVGIEADVRRLGELSVDEAARVAAALTAAVRWHRAQGRGPGAWLARLVRFCRPGVREVQR